MRLQALTLDLDDTLWPIAPVMARAEQCLLQWLGAHAPATAAKHDAASLRRLRDRVAEERPAQAYDFSALRIESIRRALADAGDDPALAPAAFEAFFDERQRVQLYDDVLPALGRLAARWPLVALSNGNGDLQRIGLGRYFTAAISAREFGIGKPDAAIFHEACRAAGATAPGVLHVGDDPCLDVDGAHGAGLHAAWLRRGEAASGRMPQRTPRHVVADLQALAEVLGA